uniref:Uncharacterized protein n=1 Tax=Oreochromis niloticus TaxID=8128 RepID=A0A669BWT8_ORENI
CLFVFYIFRFFYSVSFLLNDTVSASSNMDMEDRVSHLEQRLQLQEDEIQLLKAALADALRRLGYCEEQKWKILPTKMLNTTKQDSSCFQFAKMSFF